MENTVRAVAMDSTDGLGGLPVNALGRQLACPLGQIRRLQCNGSLSTVP